MSLNSLEHRPEPFTFSQSMADLGVTVGDDGGGWVYVQGLRDCSRVLLGLEGWDTVGMMLDVTVCRKAPYTPICCEVEARELGRRYQDLAAQAVVLEREPRLYVKPERLSETGRRLAFISYL